MKALYGIAFLIVSFLPGAFAQSICTDSRYVPGGFTLSSTDICHNETVTVTNTGGVENPKYYYNYRGETYEEVTALGGAAPDFSTVTKPGLFQVIQVGKKDGKETVSCREIKVRNSTTPVFSYTFCTGPTRIEVIIPQHPLNDYSSYQMNLNGTVYPLPNTNFLYSFPVQNIPNSITITGQGGTKRCATDPLPTEIPLFNASGRDYEYYPEIKELKVLEDKKVSIDFRGQYEQTYNLFRYEGGQPNVGLSPVRAGLKAGTPVTDTPPDTSKSYCYYIQPAIPGGCGVFSLKSADICSVPLTSPIPPTTIRNYLKWASSTPSSVSRTQVDLLKNTDGSAETPKPVSGFTYEDTHGDCTQRICYRIRVTYSGVISYANFSGTSLSNPLCFDHRIELTDFPPNAFVTTENRENLVRFDTDKSSPYNLDRWEVFKYDGADYTLFETLPAGATDPLITDPGPVAQSEKYKVRYADECANLSAFSPVISSLYLTEDGNNVLHWSPDSPFAGTDLLNYEVVYYEGDDQDRILGTQPVNASVYAHPVNSASFTNMGTFRVKAIDSEGKVSFSNPVTFAVKGSLLLPTAFSPNGDNTNDTFAVKGSLGGIRNFRMEIFTASGQKIADISDPVLGWDGRLPNGDRALFGNYLYTLKAEMTNGQEISKNGSFILLY